MKDTGIGSGAENRLRAVIHGASYYKGIFAAFQVYHKIHVRVNLKLFTFSSEQGSYSADTRTSGRAEESPGNFSRGLNSFYCGGAAVCTQSVFTAASRYLWAPSH